MSDLWEISALVTRYETPVGTPPQVLTRGCFAHSCAQWWLPICATHGSALLPPYALAHAYRETAEGLVVDFKTSDDELVFAAMDRTLEFSVDFGYPPGAERVERGELYAVMAIPPPDRGACPGTGVLGLRLLPDVERVAWSFPVPNEAPPATIKPARRASRFSRRRARSPIAPPCNLGAEIRDRWAIERDDWDPSAFFSDPARRGAVR